MSSPPATPTPNPTTTSTIASDPRLTPLEAQVLTEYAKLRQNLDDLADTLADLAANPSGAVADGLRGLERKTALVCTALKSSVYGIVLQQQIEFADGSNEGSVAGSVE